MSDTSIATAVTTDRDSSVGHRFAFDDHVLRCEIVNIPLTPASVSLATL